MGRRAAGEGTIYKDGAYWRVEVQWTDETGTHRKRRKRRTRTEAVAARDQLIREIREGRVPTGEAATTTVAGAIMIYLTAAEGRVRARTLRDYKRSLAPTISILGGMRAHAVRRKDVTRLLAAINGERAKQLAYVLTKAALGPYLHRVDPVEHPFPPRATPRTRKHIVPPFDHGLVARILAAVRGGPLELYVHLALASGLRQSALLGLTWSDVRADHLVVRQQLDEYVRELGPTKTDGSRRRNDQPDHVVRMLAAHAERERGAGRATGPGDLVFRNEDGGPMNAANLRRSWRRVRKRHGLPNFRLYDLRHAHASLLAEAGVASKVIAERLGHASTRLTDDTYSHLMPGMQHEAKIIVARILESENQPDE